MSSQQPAWPLQRVLCWAAAILAVAGALLGPLAYSVARTDRVADELRLLSARVDEGACGHRCPRCGYHLPPFQLDDREPTDDVDAVPDVGLELQRIRRLTWRDCAERNQAK